MMILRVLYFQSERGGIIKMNRKEKNLELMKPDEVLSCIIKGEGLVLERTLQVQMCRLLKGK